MLRRVTIALSLAGVVLILVPRSALGIPITIVQDRIYRMGVFLVVDALVANQTAGQVHGVEVTVEFRDFFGDLIRVEHTVARPVTLGPGDVGSLRVVTPYGEGVRRLAYRFTWREDGEQFQAVVTRDVWRLGTSTYVPGRGR